jgi:medium-chain acyl-[acyl-carrier-protein] hydrolase
MKQEFFASAEFDHLNRWICTDSLRSERLNLFCFPHAGGSALIYRDWQKFASDLINVCPIELPGRGRRIMDELFQELHTAVKATALALHSVCRRKPFAIFGHSLGALLAYEVERFFEEEFNIRAQLLIVSGTCPPHLQKRETVKWNLPAADLLEEIRSLGGTPPELLDNPSVIDFLLPIIRADFRMVETYEWQQRDPLDCPILAMGGISDPGATRDDICAWRCHTNDRFSFSMFEGDHFYIGPAGRDVVRKILRALRDSIEPSVRL